MRTRPIFYGWWVTLSFMVMVFLSTGIRFTVGPFLKPVVAELGLDRASFSLVISLSLFLYGAFQPFVGRLVDRFGARSDGPRGRLGGDRALVHAPAGHRALDPRRRLDGRDEHARAGRDVAHPHDRLARDLRRLRRGRGGPGAAARAVGRARVAGDDRPPAGRRGARGRGGGRRRRAHGRRGRRADALVLAARGRPVHVRVLDEPHLRARRADADGPRLRPDGGLLGAR